MTRTEKRDWWSQEFRKMVTLGESNTAGGWSSSPERCWAPRLEALISDVQASPVKLFNAGIGANVISTRSPSYELSGKPAALIRLDKHVIEPNPDLLIVSYGLNDARGGTPVDLFAEEMVSLIDRVREKIQPLIVLLGPYFITDFQRGAPNWSKASPDIMYAFDDVISGIARAKDCLFVELMDIFDRASWLIHYDGVHNNDVGHLVIATRIFQVLVSSCSGPVKHTKAIEKESPRWRDESVLKSDYGESGRQNGSSR